MAKVNSAAIKERKNVSKRNHYEFVKLNEPEKYAELLKKERERYQKRIETKKLKNITDMTEREKRAKRKQWKINKRNYRRKKKENSTIQEVNIEQAEEVNQSTNTQEKDPLEELNDNQDSQINSRMSRLTRLIGHLKNKLKFHEQKIRRLQSINNRYRFKIHRLRKDKNNQRPNKQSKIHFPTIINEIHKFYEEDTNSRQAAGKKEFITRQGTKKTKRYLVMSLKNLYNKFITTSEIKISYSTFCKYRPFWVVFPKPNNRETCSCEIHVNIKLLIEALHKAKIINEKSDYDFINALCCSPKTDNCLLKTCEGCKDKEIICNEFNNTDVVEFSYWCKIKEPILGDINKVKIITTKKKEKAKPLDLIEKLRINSNRFLKHCFTIEKQYKEMKKLKDFLRNNEAIIHMDWSENYELKYHEEVQSMHFGGTLDVHQVLWDIFCGQDLTFRNFSCFICEANVQCEHGAHLGFLRVPDFTHSVEVTTLADARNMSANIPIYVTVATTQDDSQNNTVFTELSNIDPVTLSTPSTSKSYMATFCDFEELVPANSLSSLEMLKENVEQLPIGSTSGEVLNLHVADWVLIKKTRRAIKHQIGRVIGICGDNISISVLNKVPGGFRWPKLRKREVISMNCIKAVLPEPNIDAKLNFHFENIDFIHY
ncbi:unnamed protein product [Arctia plantaginis]|uniref:Uncharacterized protein n=1 Tax=Arctia plantaginis TaxID=874455 RepID=A0A8S1AGS2_ARCPL|nr:unnamed protein product [Arctia plantaginis]